jgi:hypothetical protein
MLKYDDKTVSQLFRELGIDPAAFPAYPGANEFGLRIRPVNQEIHVRLTDTATPLPAKSINVESRK